ncbi:hypothetical protein AB6846_05855 [Serratia proteamaculans]
MVKGTEQLAMGFGLSSFHLAHSWLLPSADVFLEVAVGLEDLPSERQSLLLQGELQVAVRLPVSTPLRAAATAEQSLGVERWR